MSVLSAVVQLQLDWAGLDWTLVIIELFVKELKQSKFPELTAPLGAVRYAVILFTDAFPLSSTQSLEGLAYKLSCNLRWKNCVLKDFY